MNSHLTDDERSVPWADPWELVNDSNTPERELQRELSPGHALSGIPVVSVAGRNECDDVLFRLTDGSGRYAVVHLTYSYSGETNPAWPETIIYESLSHFVAERLREDVADYNARLTDNF